MNKQNIQIWIPTFFALLFIFGVFIGTQLDSNVPFVTLQNNSGRTYSSAIGHGKIEEMLRYIKAKYVDEADAEALMDAAMESVMMELDPHSSYIPSDELENINEQLEGNFDGIGVEFIFVDDTVMVVTPLTGGPAETAGIMAGDKILKIADTLVAGVEKSLEDITELLRGERGTTIELEVLSNRDKNIKKFKVTRDAIPIKSVDVAYMIDDKTGYIKVNRFSASTYEEFMQALERLVEKQDMQDLIIDVRHNPGGYLQQATNLLSQFFTEKGKLLVYTEGRTVKRTDYKTSGRVFFPIEKIAVLIDEGSASASEILAGAIQDLDRGIIVGRRSFGKGLVQEQYNLNDGSALRLTVAKYYTPSGRSIQRPYDDLENYDTEVATRQARGEFANKDSIKIDDTHPYYTEKGRIVYGGGGITPDVFVPIDTVMFNETYLALRQHIPQHIFRWLQERPYIKQIPVAQAAYGTEDYQQFIRYCQEKGVYVQDAEAARLQPELTKYLHARMAKQLEGDEAFYRLLNTQDNVVQAALVNLKSKEQTLLRAKR